MRILGYVRCSTVTDPRAALKHQISTIRGQFPGSSAKVRIVAELSPSMRSGQRPILDQLLDNVSKRARPFDVLVVTDTSRISRDLKRVSHVEAVLRQAGIDLLAISELERGARPVHGWPNP